MESEPIVAARDGQVIEGVRIEASGEPAITVRGRRNVTIQDVEIHHDGAHGIHCFRAPGILIKNVSIVHRNPDAGPLPSQENNIHCEFSDGLQVVNARLRGGSTGVWVLESDNAHLSNIEGYDFRGPFPRGQLVQFDKSHDCILQDFSVINDPEFAWTEDNVSVFYSNNCVVRRGLIDGNNSPSGVGVMFEESRQGLVVDVDALRMGNGAFSAYPGHGITFLRTRARDNICEDQGRGEPLSNALVWAGRPSSSDLRLEQSRYDNVCNPSNIVWNRDPFQIIEVTEGEFAARSPIVHRFPWEED